MARPQARTYHIDHATRPPPLHITLTGEWRSHGAWQRDVDVILNTTGLPPG